MSYKSLSVIVLFVFLPVLVSAQKYLSTDAPEISQEWQGYTFTSEKTIVENFKDVPQLSFMTDVLEQPSVQKALEKNEMVTIFVISDNAFSEMDEKQKDSITGNKRLLQSMAKYLTVPGRIDKNGLEMAINQHGGTAYLKSLEGENLGVTQKDGKLFLIDSKGRVAAVTSSNFYHKRGLFHIVDGLVFPNSE